ncbi:MAG: hypothetical protein MUF87_07790 [Anaerolineae bacterium]|jgi:hypothetical protein|nr:hypothetical protein [Anaerolineae bacterium]
MRLILGMCLILLVLSACAATGEDAAARAVEQYLQAKVETNETEMRRLLCSPLESQLQLQMSFASIEARIEDMACQSRGDNLVRCEGRIVATYGTEEQEFPLGAYGVVQEDGEWKWCGEAE